MDLSIKLQIFLFQAARAPAPVQAAPQPMAANGAANGSADYSAQWAEYYRSTGKHKEAEAIEAQMKAKVTCFFDQGSRMTG